MAPADPSNKGRVWRRSMIWGFLSALLGGVCFSLLLYPIFGRHVEGALMFVLLGFAFPALIDSSISNVLDLLLVIVYWSAVGALIGYYARNNRAAIGIWLLVYIIASAISIALFGNIMN